MGLLALVGGFAAAALGIWIAYRYIRNRVRRFSQNVFGNSDILSALEELDTIADENPKSLNGCDALLLPQILKDFPDFDPELMKRCARATLEERYTDRRNFTVHNVVIARYLPSGIRKTIVLQAAASYEENGRTQQKRYTLNYEYALETADTSIAANCPNCGGALGYGVTVCPYCDSRVANVMGNTWAFTEITEA